jgi:probable selenium-dependent hydroxylase accessory protein YqeC
VTITEQLGLPLGGVAAVIGCGGKTSLIEAIARETLALRPKLKIMVSPTTKMYPPKHSPVPYMGVLDEETGKLTALPPEELKALLPRYGLILLEADGSKGLPCKGWREDEPAVPEFCTHTVGVFPVTALGLAATAENVHRLGEFLALTGLREGEEITEAALARMVCGEQGMFKNAVGDRFLIANQAEDDAKKKAAQSILARIKAEYPHKFEMLLFGSVFSGEWHEF